MCVYIYIYIYMYSFFLSLERAKTFSPGAVLRAALESSEHIHLSLSLHISLSLSIYIYVYMYVSLSLYIYTHYQTYTRSGSQTAGALTPCKEFLRFDTAPRRRTPSLAHFRERRAKYYLILCFLITP